MYADNAPKKPKGYYVYLWLRYDGTPYYVGKGKGRRAFIHYEHKGVHPPKDPAYILIQEYSSEDEAFRAEAFLIEYYGRKCLGTGCLLNVSDGGNTIYKRWTEHNLLWDWDKAQIVLEDCIRTNSCPPFEVLADCLIDTFLITREEANDAVAMFKYGDGAAGWNYEINHRIGTLGYNYEAPQVIYPWHGELPESDPESVMAYEWAAITLERRAA